MPDADDFRFIGKHADQLKLGRQVAPGERLPREAVADDDPLLAEGLLIDADPEPDELQGDALEERARDLDIKGRSKMNAPELRAAIAKAEKEAKAR